MRFGGRSRLILIGGILVLLLAGAVGFVFYQNRKPLIAIPAAITKEISFPIYIPKQLPDGFSVELSSFQHISSEGVLLFQATDKAGDKLVFSEQPKPENFDFNDFNTKQLINSKSLPNVPYPTTIGKTIDKQTTLISIVTDRTWIIATTQTELSNQQLLDVAASLHKY